MLNCAKTGSVWSNWCMISHFYFQSLFNLIYLFFGCIFPYWTERCTKHLWASQWIFLLFVINGLMQSEGKWTRGLGCCHTAFNWDLIGARRLGHGNHDHMPVRGDVLRCMLSKSLQNPPQSDWLIPP